MSVYISFFISFCIGWLINAVILRKSRNVDFLFKFFLSIGVGLGCSSLITFFSFLLYGGFNRTVIVCAHLCVLVFLTAVLFLNRSLTSDGENKKLFHIHGRELVYGALFFLLTFMVYTIARGHPYGEWDGWAAWNMKAKFLLSSGNSWQSVCRELHWHTQPDYPLLLPFINVWGWSLSLPQKDLLNPPLVTAVLFTVSCAGMLFCGLRKYTKDTIAFLACLILFASSNYIFVGTAQYADIILAYYLLASLITLVIALRENDEGCACLSGLLLGLLSFTKNEGMVISALLWVISSLYLILEKSSQRKQNLRLISYTAVGLSLSVPAVFIFKFFLTLPNPDNSLKYIMESLISFNIEHCYMIINALTQEFSKPYWQRIWLIIALGITLGFRKLFHKEIKVLFLFFLSYALTVFLIYLSTVNLDLAWRLSRTLSRILLYVLPSLIFFAFYACFYSGQRTE